MSDAETILYINLALRSLSGKVNPGSGITLGDRCLARVGWRTLAQTIGAIAPADVAVFGEATMNDTITTI